MFKITCISDTHNKHDNIAKNLLENTEGSKVLIHAGDVSGRGYETEVKMFLDWYSQLNNYEYKILIAGNHDFYFQDYPKKAEELLKQYPNIIYLNDSGVEIEGIKIWGSPIQPEFFNWAFNRKRGEEIKKHWDLIPKDTKILITHGPVYGHGDLVINRWSNNNGDKVGCQDLLKVVEKIKPQVHICGHIHCGSGVTTNGITTFINASVLNEDYNIENEPRIFELTI
jgi:Icc-related predicted phosphoesterase